MTLADKDEMVSDFNNTNFNIYFEEEDDTCNEAEIYNTFCDIWNCPELKQKYPVDIIEER